MTTLLRVRLFAGIAAVIAATAANANAQPQPDRSPLRVFGSAGWMSLWDDETLLGRGVLAGGGVAAPLADRVSVEAELSGGRHRRDAGYLAAEGTPILAVGRLAYHFRPSSAAARPFASAGLGVLHSTGQLTTRSIVPDDRGLPVEGPSTRRDWSVTRPAFEFGGGVSIRTTPRLDIRPEFRWIASGGDANRSSTLEPPLTMWRAGVAFEWRTARGR
jgi:opacity protein-like surface antigen